MSVLLLGLAFDICKMLANLFQVLFDFFLQLAQQTTDIIDISDLVKNIYVLLSVVMIFYVSFVLLTYMVDPNKISGKSGVSSSKFFIKIVVSIALLALSPTIFDMLTDFQTAVLNPEDNILGRIILAQPATDGYTNEDFNSNGSQIVRTVFRATLTPVDPDDKTLEEDPYFSMNYNSLGNLKTYAEDEANYNFNWGMTIVTFVLLTLVLFNFLFDISIRIFKLLFMEIIAPIPILSYCLPKKNFFDKWVKLTLGAYASLFVRVIIIYFAVFCITALNLNEASSDNMMINLFLIIGILLFAKELPGLISALTGIKPEGNFSLNPMDRIRNVPVLGRATQAVGAGIGGLVTGTALGYRAAGGFRGVAEGFKKNGFKGGMKNLGTSLGTVGKTSSLGMLYGGRAGAQQVSWGGISKNNRPKTTGYKAGATSVAQAITGNDKATSGIVDRVFNNIGTELNKPNYAQSKVIEDAQKDYDKAVQDLNTSQDSYNEIASKHSISSARVAELQGQMSTVDTELNTFRTNKLTNRATMIANETTKIDNQIAAYQTNRQSIINDATADITAKQIELRGKKSSMSQSQYNKQYTALEKQKTAITSQVNTAIDNEITNLQVQKNTISTTIDNKLEVQENEIVTRRDTISRNLSTEQAEFGALDSQLSAAKTEVANNTAAVATAKANVETEKDKLKEMNGPYMKNK